MVGILGRLNSDNKVEASVAAKFVPSDADWRRFHKALKTVTPKPKVWRAYSEDVQAWGRSPGSYPELLRLANEMIAIREFTFMRSELFGQDYPVVEATSGIFSAAFKNLNAAAVIPDVHPPFVLVPPGGLRKRSESHRSILEHEFVHINQIINGSFPVPPKVIRSEDVCLRFFAAIVEAEFQANLLQLTKWPSLYPRRWKLSLLHWCSLRAYTAALEGTIEDLLATKTSGKIVLRVISSVKNDIVRLLSSTSIDPTFIVSVAQKCVQRHLAIATQVVVGAKPYLAESRAYRHLAASTLSAS